MSKTTPKKRKTKADMRVEIAKDVLKQLGEGRIEATDTKYCRLSAPVFEMAGTDRGHSELRSLITNYEKKSPVTCEACAIGSLFMSAVMRHNDCTIKNATWSSLASGVLRDYLSKWFSKSQMWLIESAFQGSPYGTVDHESDLYERCAKIHYKYEYDTDKRLAAIMRNIIRNGGTFKP
jgi:hypothetical protein